MAAKARSIWRCRDCGATSPRWVGRCPECREYDTYAEESEAGAASVSAASATAARAVDLFSASVEETPRIPTGIPEFDRVLGGGLVHGSLVLLGGEPGIGKSTLLLQAAGTLAATGQRVAIVCGEESPAQVGSRARRLGMQPDNVVLIPETNVASVEAYALSARPDVLVVDSIQTMYDPSLDGAAGGVAQVRAATARLMHLAKVEGITVIIVGHVTKDGNLAGPRILEHMVDTVLYFEGDRDGVFRIVRAVKNRFGASSEIGVFEMAESGLVGVRSLSEAFLDSRGAPSAGSVLFVANEGSRPLVVEIQALVSPSYLPSPRRLATGIDTARLLQVVAVLERHAGVSFASSDVIVTAVGGIRVTETSVDLPLAAALLSAKSGTPLSGETAAFGEVALTGRVRPAPRADQRRAEAGALGISRVLSSDSVPNVSELASHIGLVNSST